MANLVLTNPSEPPETLKAIITAINLDEAAAATTNATLASQGTSIGPLQTTVTSQGTTIASQGTAITALQAVPILAPTVIYSVAGTPLPGASSALKGARAVVSDATTPLYLVAYAGGGAVVCPVFCNGSAWVTA
jgi:hypothetical protein